MHTGFVLTGTTSTSVYRGVARQRNSSVCSQSVPHSPLRGKAGTSTSMTLSAAAGPGGPVATQRGITIQDALAPAVDSTTTSNASAHTQPQQQLQHGAPSLQESTKTVYLIRHGEGWHNVGYEHNLDPHLTPRGWAQTGALQQHLAALQPQLNLELVVVSPLRRTLETAAGVFGAAAPPASLQAAKVAGAVAAATAPAAPAAPSGGWVWMRPQQHKPLEVSRRDIIYLPAAGCAAAAAASACRGDGASGAADGGAGSADRNMPLRILAHEGCRERIGPNVCDKFRDIALQEADFPGVDFSLIQHKTDKAWERVSGAAAHDGGCYLIGEEEVATEQRAVAFYKWLMSRPESRIAVVSHCGFLAHGMRALGKDMLKTWSDAMLQQCSSNASNDSSAAPVRPDGNATALGTGSLSTALDAQRAELLRSTAGELAGRMSVDWHNCEMRSVQLCWGPGVHHAPDAVGDGDAAGQGWLWAKPGDAAEWFPGGLTGLEGFKELMDLN